MLCKSIEGLRLKYSMFIIVNIDHNAKIFHVHKSGKFILFVSQHYYHHTNKHQQIHMYHKVTTVLNYMSSQHKVLKNGRLQVI